MSGLRLPRLISDGMILQQKKKIRIWGEDEPGRKITALFLGQSYTALTDKEGRWEFFLQDLKPGKCGEMLVSDDGGSSLRVQDILAGDVFFCSGQSNMELPMNRVKDRYPEEIKNCSNAAIRTFKITEHADFHGPLKELQSGEWKAAGEDTILDFSATAYFFAKKMYAMTGIPVGLINASLGGSRIESWMSREMLEGYEDFLALADRYAQDDFVAERLLQNQRQTEEWHSNLDEKDTGLKEHWERPETDISRWEKVQLPFFFQDTFLKDFIGSVWFRKSFQASPKLAGGPAKLWLGTIVDSDTVYLNGVQVGHTDYQYPPRKYDIPAGLLKEGENILTIRVKCENGQGRFTKDKVYAVFHDKERTDLTGEWYCRIGGRAEQIKETDFVNWKPTGLYNGMTAPCMQYGIAGVLWYQGEANTRNAESYFDLTKRLVEGYRKNWEDDALPFFYVQLPNFSGEIYDLDREGKDGDWPALREQQRKALAIQGTAMAVAIDLGEDNDLHPLNKEGVGTRLALLAAKALYGLKSPCEGPQIMEAAAENKPEGRTTVLISCKNAEGGLCIKEGDKGKELLDFEAVDRNGRVFPLPAELAGSHIRLSCPMPREALLEIRYCYHNTNKGALIYNQEGFPMSPFVLQL